MKKEVYKAVGFFQEYRDRNGIGSEEWFDSYEEAYNYANQEWNNLVSSDKKSYLTDIAAIFYAETRYVPEWLDVTNEEALEDWLLEAFPADGCYNSAPLPEVAPYEFYDFLEE